MNVTGYQNYEYFVCVRARAHMYEKYIQCVYYVHMYMYTFM